MTTILLADDHLLVRDTIAAYLTGKGGYDVRLASSAHEAIVMLAGDDPIDLAIFDYQMPGMDGLDGLSRLRELHPNQRVAILSGVATPDVADEAMEMGALAFFPKSMPVNKMLDGIGELVPGDTPPRAGRSTEAGESPKSAPFGLTSRERQILEMLTLGRSNKVIAQELVLKEVTVKFHVTNIMSKMGVTNRTQAALLAKSAEII
ncbi:MAG: response regulator transcription factor [Pseudomonadota bacterium]